MSQAGRYNVIVAGSGNVNTITGELGGSVTGDAAGNVNLVGSGDLVVTGTPGTNTLTISFAAGSNAITQLGTDAGTAQPVAGLVDIVTADALLDSSAAGNTVTLTTGATVPNSFATDGGAATPAAHVLTIAGGDNITTSSGASTVTVALDPSISITTMGALEASINDIFFDTATANLSETTSFLQSGTGAGEELLFRAYNNGAITYQTFATLTSDISPSFDLEDTVTKAQNYIYRANGTDVAVIDGGSGRSTATAYAVICGGTVSTNPHQSIASVGSSGQILTSNGAGALPTFAANAASTTFATDGASATPAAGTITIAGGTGITTSGAGSTVTVTLDTDVAVADGGTGASSFTAYAVICGGTLSTNPLQAVASVGSAGQVLTSNGAGTLPTFQATTGGIAWSEVSGTSQAMAINNGYITNNAALVTCTLPDTAALGSIVRVAGSGAGGWRIAQNAGEPIRFVSSSTTVGAGGRLDSTNRYDAVELVCITANTTWTVISSVGNITVT